MIRNLLKRLFAARRHPPSDAQAMVPAAPAAPHHSALDRSLAEDHFVHLVAGLQGYAIFLLDAEGHVLTWNAGAEKLKGYPAEEIIGRHFSCFYPEEVIASGWPAYELKEATAVGRFEDEGWRVRQDGSLFWANVIITALRDDEGQLTGFLKVTRDLTERMRAEEALRISEERFRLLVEGVKDYAIFMLNPQGVVTTWNAGAQYIKGYAAEEIIGQHFSLFYPAEAIEQGWPEEELSLAEEQGRIEDEGWRIRKDGTRFWANVVITALHDEQGRLRGFAKVTRDMTERRQAEEKERQLLREEAARQAAEASSLEARLARDEERRQRERFLVTLASIGDGVIVTDEQARVTFLNSVSEGLTGWSLAEAQGQPLESIFRIVNQQTRQPTANPVERALLEGRIVGLANHTILIAKDGSEYAIDDSASPIREEDGTVIGVILVFRDVTRQQAAKLALQDSEQRLRLAMEAGRMGSWHWDIAQERIAWSETLERIHGLQPGEFGGTFEDYQHDIHPGDREQVLEQIQHSVETGADHHLVYRIIWPDSSIHWLEARGKLFHDEQGQPQRMIGVCSDITERKQQEQSLHFLAQASKSLSTLVDYRSTLQKVAWLAVPGFADWCVVDMLDADGLVQRLASAHIDPSKVLSAEELTRRYPPDPNSTRGIFQVLRTGNPEYMTDIPESMLAEVAQDEEHLGMLRELGLNSYICVPLRAKDRVLGALTFVGAESGRRYVEADLELAEDLAHRASIAIENARLYQQLRDADLRKDEFLAMLAHELRNPLAPLRSGLDLLAMDSGHSPETIGLMQEQVEHIIRLVDDLMDVSRIMRGKVELRRVPVEIAGLVRRSVQTVRPLIESHQQHLTVDVPESPIWIDADPVRIVQVLENLLHNASKYTDPRGRIELTATEQADEVLLELTDSGVGLEPELLPTVFELFTQSSRSLDRAQGGLGIGLTLVKNLVELHGGRVTAHSDGPGQGSTFAVRLPVAAAPQVSSQPADPASNTQSLRILVVDDNLGAAQLLAMLLSKIDDHQVDTAHDGPSALEKIKQTHPQIVFLDIGLPGMDGYQVGQAIRELPEFDDVLLVALTGYGQEDDRQRSKNVGFDEHLVKPPSVEQIMETLRHRKLAK